MSFLPKISSDSYNVNKGKLMMVQGQMTESKRVGQMGMVLIAKQGNLSSPWTWALMELTPLQRLLMMGQIPEMMNLKLMYKVTFRPLLIQTS